MYELCSRTYVVWIDKTIRWALLEYRSGTTMNEWLSTFRTYWIRYYGLLLTIVSDQEDTVISEVTGSEKHICAYGAPHSGSGCV